MLVDLPEDELRRYRSASTEPDDFDEFWSVTLAEAREHPLDVRLSRVEVPVRTVEVYDLTFRGFGGQPISAWLRLPAGAQGPLPAIVEFVGYGGGRGHCLDDLLWASSGYAHLVMDSRGQGSAWSPGATGDDGPTGASFPGFLTRGILDPRTYYYRRLYTDAVRAVEAARSLDRVDAERVAVQGRSQGGGVSLAVAGLAPDLVAAAAPRVPFLCDFRRALLITDAHPYQEIVRYLAVHRGHTDDVHRTLGYVDGVFLARRARVPARFSTALMDPVCPPSTVFAAYNEYAGDKSIDVWPYNAHEGGGRDDDEAVLRWFAQGVLPQS